MNDHKFCFIICTNNSLMLEECVHYINHLTVPEDFEIELLTVNDASSMTQGYNEALVSSDAKYKIYMHQDVFLLNKNILNDLLDIFHADPQIGLIGMIGYDTISPDGIMWHQKRIGNLYLRRPPKPYPSLSDYHYSLKEDGYSLAALLDGFFLATSQDLEWNTQLLKGWDFYDAFQCINFLEHGYKIAVPTQTFPWCIHDDNQFPILFHYNHYRQIFMQTYKAYLGKSYTDILKKQHA